MVNLKNKVVNCYDHFLNNLVRGNSEQKYCMLKNAIHYLKEKDYLENRLFDEYFYNNLFCSGSINLIETETTHMTIGYAVSDSPTFKDNFNWKEFPVKKGQTYTFSNYFVDGYNYLYINIPLKSSFQIYDALGRNLTDEFEYKGYSVVTSENKTNRVFRKKDVYNTMIDVPFKILII